MNKFRQRHWSFVRPQRSMALLFLEAFGSVCGMALLVFLPFRYEVKCPPPSSPIDSNGVFQLGKELSRTSSEILDMRDPAGVFSPGGRAGYLRSLPPSGKKSLTVEESFRIPNPKDATLVFQPFPEKEPPPSPLSPLRKIERSPVLSAGVILTPNGRLIEKIEIPSGMESNGGQTLIRLAGGREFPRCELLRSCGSKKMDELALGRCKKLLGREFGVIAVCWPQQKAVKRAEGK